MVHTYKINDETAIAVAASRGVEECLPIGRRNLAKCCREATGVRIRVAKVEDGWEFAGV